MSRDPKLICRVEKRKAGARVDQYLSGEIPDFSRSRLAKLVREKLVTVNGNTIKASYIVKENDIVKINLPKDDIPGPSAEHIPLDIVYEDKNVIVIDKPAGMVVHPAANNNKETLVSALLDYYPEIKNAVVEKNNSISMMRAGIVHRLDKDTSGVMIVAKNKKALEYLSKEIKNRKIEKIYWALCLGWPENESGELTNYIGRHKVNRKQMAEIGEGNGRKAVSRYEVLKYFKDLAGQRFSLVEFDIETGRTHQIRLQSKLMGHPIAGDPVYNTKESIRHSKELSATRQLLHAKQLSIRLPWSNKTETFSADIPDDFEMALSRLTEIK